jgi:hypothetical protein
MLSQTAAWALAGEVQVRMVSLIHDATAKPIGK